MENIQLNNVKMFWILKHNMMMVWWWLIAKTFLIDAKSYHQNWIQKKIPSSVNRKGEANRALKIKQPCFVFSVWADWQPEPRHIPAAVCSPSFHCSVWAAQRSGSPRTCRQQSESSVNLWKKVIWNISDACVRPHRENTSEAFTHSASQHKRNGYETK